VRAGFPPRPASLRPDSGCWSTPLRPVRRPVRRQRPWIAAYIPCFCPVNWTFGGTFCWGHSRAWTLSLLPEADRPPQWLFRLGGLLGAVNGLDNPITVRTVGDGLKCLAKWSQQFCSGLIKMEPTLPLVLSRASRHSECYHRGASAHVSSGTVQSLPKWPSPPSSTWRDSPHGPCPLLVLCGAYTVRPTPLGVHGGTLSGMLSSLAFFVSNCKWIKTIADPQMLRIHY